MKIIYETTAPSGTTECRKGDVVKLYNGTSFLNGKEQTPSRYYTTKARLMATTENGVKTLIFF